MDVLSAHYNLRYWLALKFIPRLGVHKKLALVDKLGINTLFSDASCLETLSLTSKQKQAITAPDWQKIEQVINASELCNSTVISYQHPDYPQQLKQLYDPPLVLFVQGDSQLLASQQVAIVGSRSSTASGKDIAKQFASELCRYQLTITSGLALGIDGSAHAGAIIGQGKTIAVVATGLDRVYPSRHKSLANKIIESGGAIVSEFVPGTAPKPGLFPKRNRIISGLSLGVLVVEAEIKSGSLVTARCALEQNKEVFAVPGSIYNGHAKGCHWLIKQGAKLVEECADIVEELAIDSCSSLNLSVSIPKRELNNRTEHLSSDPLLASVGFEITPIDMIVSRSNLPIDIVLTQLTMLELKGLVTAVPGGYLKVSPNN